MSERLSILLVTLYAIILRSSYLRFGKVEAYVRQTIFDASRECLCGLNCALASTGESGWLTWLFAGSGCK